MRENGSHGLACTDMQNGLLLPDEANPHGSVTPTLARVDGRYETRVCDWCRGEISNTSRVDAITCSKRCRQARHRFLRGGVARRPTTDPLRLAYADPPYPGMAKRYYAEHPDYAGEVDHRELVSHLATFDGWALSTSARSLPDVLALCVAQGLRVRVAAWLRGHRPTVSAWPMSAWEPVVFAGGRQEPSRVDRVDALTYFQRPRLADPFRVVGAKPAAFVWWLFDLLGALPGDTFDDLFPGSGRVAQAWLVYESRSTSPIGATPGTRDASRSSTDDRDATVCRRISSDSRLKYTVTATPFLNRSPEISP